MLDTNPADGSLLSITICEGPAGINAIAGLSDKQQDHSHHHGHDNSGNENDYLAQDHSFSACSFWSSSNQLLLTELPFFDIKDFLFSDEVLAYQGHTPHRLFHTTRLTRAPPTLS